jgi:hypothetical protein
MAEAALRNSLQVSIASLILAPGAGEPGILVAGALLSK